MLCKQMTFALNFVANHDMQCLTLCCFSSFSVFSVIGVAFYQSLNNLLLLA